MSEINKTEEIPEDTFPINLKLIQKYQRAEPSLMAKKGDGTYDRGSFGGGSNIDLNPIMCEDKIFIISIVKKNVLHWYHTYLLHPGMDRTEATIYQYLYCTQIIHVGCK